MYCQESLFFVLELIWIWEELLLSSSKNYISREELSLFVPYKNWDVLRYVFRFFIPWRILFLLVCIYQGGKVYESGIGCILSRELVPSHLVDLSTNNSSSIFALWIRILWISIAWKILLTKKKQTSSIEYNKHVPSHLVVLLIKKSHPFHASDLDKRLPKAKRTYPEKPGKS